jgi:hypothetical protein
MSYSIDDVAGELRGVAFALRRLGTLRPALTYDERLRIGELLRDAADQIDHGVGPVTSPAAQLEQVTDETESSRELLPPATGEFQVPVRQLSAVRRSPG